jgi:UDP-glucuronate decarboxylase
MLFLERREKINFHGGGNQSRAFLWVEDAVDCIVGNLFNDTTRNEIFNIAGEERINLNQLAELILELGKSLQMIPENYMPEIGGKNRGPIKSGLDKIACTIKAKNLLGYSAKHNLEQCFHKFLLGKRN